MECYEYVFVTVVWFSIMFSTNERRPLQKMEKTDRTADITATVCKIGILYFDARFVMWWFKLQNSKLSEISGSQHSKLNFKVVLR